MVLGEGVVRNGMVEKVVDFWWRHFLECSRRSSLLLLANKVCLVQRTSVRKLDGYAEVRWVEWGDATIKVIKNTPIHVIKSHLSISIHLSRPSNFRTLQETSNNSPNSSCRLSSFSCYGFQVIQPLRVFFIT
jgi:hypothetical protein